MPGFPLFLIGRKTQLAPLSQLIVSKPVEGHRSRRLLIAESVLTDQEGRELARGSGSFMKSRVELTPEIGYTLD